MMFLFLRLHLVSLVMGALGVAISDFNCFFDGGVVVGSTHFLKKNSLPESVLFFGLPFNFLVMLHDFLGDNVVSRVTIFFRRDEAEKLGLRGQLAELSLDTCVGDIFADYVVLPESKIFVGEGAFEVVMVLLLAFDEGLGWIGG